MIIGGGGASGTFGPLLGGGNALFAASAGFRYSVDDAKLTVIGEFESFGNTTFQNLTVDDSVSIGGTLDVTGLTTLDDLDVTSTLDVTGLTTVGDLDVSGTLGNGTNNPNLAGGGIAAGFYTGTLRDRTDLPVGSIISVRTIAADRAERNDIETIYLSTFNDQYQHNGSVSTQGAQLTGTWRCKGLCGANGSTVWQIFQRVS